jgi:hypothetical protein
MAASDGPVPSGLVKTAKVDISGTYTRIECKVNVS